MNRNLIFIIQGSLKLSVHKLRLFQRTIIWGCAWSHNVDIHPLDSIRQQCLSLENTINYKCHETEVRVVYLLLHQTSGDFTQLYKILFGQSNMLWNDDTFFLANFHGSDTILLYSYVWQAFASYYKLLENLFIENSSCIMVMIHGRTGTKLNVPTIGEDSFCHVYCKGSFWMGTIRTKFMPPIC